VQVTISVDAAVISLEVTAQDATEEGIPRGVIPESNPTFISKFFYDIILWKKKKI
jgi:hypothetical protein